MVRRLPLFAFVSILAVGLLSAGWFAQAAAQARAQEKAAKDADLRAFMRKKLDACSQILEGLTTENGPLAKAGADALTELSSAEKWRVSNDVVYKQFSEEFQRTAKKLADSAEKGNFDDVTLKWIDATLSCIECHKFVRGMRIAGGR
uniref:Cytochrome C n=1 Tax=Schlesneria paludicola TaxID=360056 RepID=A0A7C2P3Y0_9PLAN